MKGLGKKQREVIIGLILGDGYLQATGKNNARLRLEHGSKQKDYIEWKYEVLKNFMQSKPKALIRRNPVWQRTYKYYRCQTHATPYLGKLRRLFYDGCQKVIPENIESLFKTPVSLAVWYMDDGSLYPRDKTAEMYLPCYQEGCLQRLTKALKVNFGLDPTIKIKKGKYPTYYFNVPQTTKLIKIISPYIVPSLEYKVSLTP